MINSVSNSMVSVPGPTEKKGLIPSEIPAISDRTIAIFKELGTNCDDLTTPVKGNKGKVETLKGKAETLNKSFQKLQHEKKHETRNKIFGVLKAALTVAVLVGLVLGTMALTFCPPAAVLVAMAGILIYTALCGYHASRVNYEVSNHFGALVLFIAGPILPIYEAFGKVSRMEKSISKQKQEVEDELKRAAHFFRQDLQGLRRDIKEKKKQAEKALEAISEFPIESKAAREDMEGKRNDYSRALDELDKAIAYYSKFGPQS